MRHLMRACAVVGLLAAPAAAWAQLCGASCAGTGGFQYSSPKGDYIGQGVTRALSAPPNLLQALRNFDKGVSIRVNMPQEGATGENWTIDFAMADKTDLKPGTYNATRWPFMEAGTAGLDWSGQGRGCNKLSGVFTVHEVTYKSDGGVQSFAADFTQSCEKFMPAARGQVRFNSTVPFTVAPTDPGAAPPDSDGDGIPDALEASLGRNPFARDNDVFGDARLFVMQAYRDFFGREGDAAGIDYWAGRISGGVSSRAEVAMQFASSSEFETAAGVARLYLAFFFRYPDHQGLNHWIAYRRSGNTLASVADRFIASEEFQRRYPPMSNRQFVALVYQNVLGRNPDPTGYGAWLGEVDGNRLTWGGLMAAFAESAEFRGMVHPEVMVTFMYARMLGRTPDPAGFSAWVGYLDAGGAPLGMMERFIASSEYRARFLQ